jgi:hypothetical protein
MAGDESRIGGDFRDAGGGDLGGGDLGGDF